MGNGMTYGTVKTNDEMNLAWLRWMLLYQRLNLGRGEFDTVFNFFCSLEKPAKPGFILSSDLENVLSFKANIFLARCFAIFEDNWSGYVNFGEFTVCLWNFCTHTPSTLFFYSFQLFPDDNTSSTLLFSKDEIVAIMWTLHWSEENEMNGSWTKLESHIQTCCSQAEGITMERFDELFPFTSIAMAPVQRLRQSIFRRILAEKYWKKAASLPIVLDENARLDVVQFKKKVGPSTNRICV
jgi:Ca2+-binding EF-hand superfamily protein